MNINAKKIIATIVALILVGLGTAGVVNIVNQNNGATEIKVETTVEQPKPEAEAVIEYAPEQVPAVIEASNGEEVTVEVPTVQAVENPVATECDEGEECGQGWYVDTTTADNFIAATDGQCVDTDGHYGSQCWDLGNLFWQNYAGRILSTCGTGAAKGVLNCVEQNAGEEFEFTTDINRIQKGAWLIFTNGQFGHIGMARGKAANGYVTLFGTNQGGATCWGGGSSANTINISLAYFGGAFIPKTYIEPEPTPEPAPVSTCEVREVQPGDTLGAIMQECRGEIEWGEPMNDYARSWTAEETGNTVFYGWTHDTGYGLIAGQTIRYEGK